VVLHPAFAGRSALLRSSSFDLIRTLRETRSIIFFSFSSSPPHKRTSASEVFPPFAHFRLSRSGRVSFPAFFLPCGDVVCRSYVNSFPSFFSFREKGAAAWSLFSLLGGRLPLPAGEKSGPSLPFEEGVFPFSLAKRRVQLPAKRGPSSLNFFALKGPLLPFPLTTSTLCEKGLPCSGWQRALFSSALTKRLRSRFPGGSLRPMRQRGFLSYGMTLSGLLSSFSLSGFFLPGWREILASCRPL